MRWDEPPLPDPNMDRFERVVVSTLVVLVLLYLVGSLWK